MFLADHDGFRGRRDVWSLAPEDKAYPSLPLSWNPSAYVGHANQIQDPTALALGWLGDLHYWTTLLLLDHAYREGDEQCIDLARMQMLGPIYSLARHMPRYGLGLPFDPLSMGYAPGLDRMGVMRIVLHMLGEATQLANSLEAQLPRRLSARRVPRCGRGARGDLSRPDTAGGQSGPALIHAGAPAAP